MLNSLRREMDMNAPNRKTNRIDIVIFDFGGVLAEKGFEEGLRAIAKRNGLDEEGFHKFALDLIYATGYLNGRINENDYWNMIRKKNGIRDNDEVLRNEILFRFTLRPWMFDIVKKLKTNGIGTAILSDQTNWLDELNERNDFFKYFDVVFNSYHLGKNKMDPSQFCDMISRLHRVPERLLFIDDTEIHCETARKAGMKTINYVDRDRFINEIQGFCLL